MKLWELENEQRYKATEQGKVIYGPVFFKQADYYNYLMANSLIQLKETLVEDNVISKKENEVKAFFENLDSQP